jgi:hypothetical protein
LRYDLVAVTTSPATSVANTKIHGGLDPARSEAMTMPHTIAATSAQIISFVTRRTQRR